MSTSIELRVERRVGGLWLGRRWEHVPDVTWDDQDYAAFSLLAGVRKRPDIVPICEVRGVPGNASAEVHEAWAKAMEDAAHSPSWATLAQLQRAPWRESSHESGIVDRHGYAQYRAQGQPTSYSQDVTGPTTLLISESEMARRFETNDWIATPEQSEQVRIALQQLAAGRRLSEERTLEVIRAPEFFVRLTWGQPLAERCPSLHQFVHEVLPRVGKPADVRCVYWFFD